MVELEDYPDKTEQILVALLEYEERDRKEEGAMMKRRLLASDTELDKEKVRYRLDNYLVEDDLVAKDKITEHNQPITYYGLRPNGRIKAKGVRELKDVLGEVPDPVEQKHVVNLGIELAAIRAELEADPMEVRKSAFLQSIDKLKSRIERLEDELDVNSQSS